MKKKLRLRNTLQISYVLILITTLLSSCGQTDQNQSLIQLSSETEQNSNKIPDQLKDIENGIEKVISTLNGPAILIEDQNSPQEKQSDTNSQVPSDNNDSQSILDDSKKQDDSKDTEQGQNENKDTAQNQSSSQIQQAKIWEEVISLTNSLHYKWNNYMPMAVKLHASNSLLDDFSKALNKLTNTLIEKDNKVTLMATNNLYFYIPEFYSLYKTKTSPEIKKIRYYVRNAIFNSSLENWDQSITSIHNLNSSWTLCKNTMDKSQQELMNKLDLSINEFDKVVLEKNNQLVEIKGKVTLSNIEAIEKSNENTTEQFG